MRLDEGEHDGLEADRAVEHDHQRATSDAAGARRPLPAIQQLWEQTESVVRRHADGGDGERRVVPGVAIYGSRTAQSDTVRAVVDGELLLVADELADHRVALGAGLEGVTGLGGTAVADRALVDELHLAEELLPLLLAPLRVEARLDLDLAVELLAVVGLLPAAQRVELVDLVARHVLFEVLLERQVPGHVLVVLQLALQRGTPRLQLSLLALHQRLADRPQVAFAHVVGGVVGLVAVLDVVEGELVAGEGEAFAVLAEARVAVFFEGLRFRICV